MDGEADLQDGKFSLKLKNRSDGVAFATRIRLTDPVTGERILPVIMSDGYVTLMPGETRTIDVEVDPSLLKNGVRVHLKQFVHPERTVHDIPELQKFRMFSGNPVFTGWYADPEAGEFDGKYWIYPTLSVNYDEQLYMDAFSSDDLVTWTKHDRIVTKDDISWLRRALWAPSVIRANGRYYLFFGANDIQDNSETGGIGVAVSDSPEGPFKDALGHPLIGSIVNGAQPIDQYVFRDDDGTYYMYYGGWGRCNVVKLSPDLLGIVPFEDGQLYKEVTPDNYTEGPCMLKKDGKYYFMWSEGIWGGPGYCVAYAISDSPFGPFRRIGKILEPDETVSGSAGHHSVIKGPGKDEWYIVYHRRPLEEKEGNSRAICIDRLYFDGSGKILPVKMTKEGVRRLVPDKR